MNTISNPMANGVLPIAAVVAGFLAISSAQAAVTYSGDISPADPSTWVGGSSGTNAYVGNTADGSLVIADGSSLSSKGFTLGNATGVTGKLTVTGPGSSSVASGARYIGQSGTGILDIENGATASNTSGFVGNNAGSSGVVTVSGLGSTWTNSSGLNVGYNGAGTLNISNGGVVSAANGGRLGNASGVTGFINIDGAGSKLTIGGTFYDGYYGNGIIAITNGGNLTTTGIARVGFNGGSTSSISVDGVGSTWNNTSNTEFRIGGDGRGTLNVTHGGIVTTAAGAISIADNASAIGVVNVDGPGSTWNASSSAVSYIGRVGNATLNIINGGKVTTSSSTINVGYASYASGTGSKVKVDGAGSSYAHTGTLYLGGAGTAGKGALIVADGGAVSATTLSLNANSALSQDIGRGSSLAVGGGSGAITNDGTIRLVAGANAADGTYTPMDYGTMTGLGTVQVLGGKWNGTYTYNPNYALVNGVWVANGEWSGPHTVTVSAAATAQAGETATLDLSTTQRLLVTDSATGHSVGFGFKGTDTPTSLSFSATEASSSEQASLQSLLEPGQGVLSAWDFTPGAGYSSSDPVYLSLEVGSGLKLTDLAIWRFDGGLWSLFSANDLAYDNQFGSFTATGFSSYAVTGPAAVPVPAAVWLFGSALAGFGVFGRCKGGLAA